MWALAAGMGPYRYEAALRGTYTRENAGLVNGASAFCCDISVCQKSSPRLRNRAHPGSRNLQKIADRVITTKLRTNKSAAVKQSPELSLGFGLIAAKRACAGQSFGGKQLNGRLAAFTHHGIRKDFCTLTLTLSRN